MRFQLAVKALLWRGIRRQDAEKMAKTFLDDPAKSKMVDDLIHKKVVRSTNMHKVLESDLYQKLGKLESFAESGMLGRESTRDLGLLRNTVSSGLQAINEGPARVAVSRILREL